MAFNNTAFNKTASNSDISLAVFLKFSWMHKSEQAT